MITKASIKAQEKEKEDLGKELHDNINQILTTTKLYIEMALVDKDIQEMLLNKSLENISKAIIEIRRLSKSLVPPSLGDITLQEAIKEMINNLNITRNIQIKLKVKAFDDSVVDDQAKLMIYRVVQEQLNNVIKHSKAKNAEVAINASSNQINVTVTDDGVGFDYKKRKGKGIGLTNIASRVEAHGGSAQIITSPGSGCILKIHIPL